MQLQIMALHILFIRLKAGIQSGSRQFVGLIGRVPPSLHSRLKEQAANLEPHPRTALTASTLKQRQQQSSSEAACRDGSSASRWSLSDCSKNEHSQSNKQPLQVSARVCLHAIALQCMHACCFCSYARLASLAARPARCEPHLHPALKKRQQRSSLQGR